MNYIYRATTAILAWFKNFLKMYVILHIFSFIPFNLLRRTICRVCKICYPITSDPAIVRKVLNHANLNQFACSKLRMTFSLKKQQQKFPYLGNMSTTCAGEFTGESCVFCEHCQTCHFRILCFHDLGKSS